MARNRLPIVLAALLAAVLLLPARAFAAGEVLYSGTWGTCPWEITDDGTLAVHPGEGGSHYVDGEMHYSYWYPHESEVTSVVFLGEGGRRVVAPEDSSYLLCGMEHVVAVDLSGLDTSSVTDMSHMFDRCSRLASIDVSGWDTSSVTDMSYMFYVCRSLTSLDLSPLDTSGVTDMSYMFAFCSRLASLDLSGWDTSSVTDMSYMFYYCSRLTSLDLSPLDTSSVTDMSRMFCDCSGLTSLDLAPLDTSRVTDMNHMFSGCSGLTTLDLSPLDTSGVTNMENMFCDCSGLTSLDLTPLDTSRVTYMCSMFFGCSGLTSLDLTPLDTSRVTDMRYMFSGCSSLASLDLSPLDTSGVTDMSYMFCDCSGLTSLDLSPLDTSNVTNMGYMFSGCLGLTSLDLSGWDTSRVSKMSYMFNRCTRLGSILVGACWSTMGVTKSTQMFIDCASLIGGCGTAYDPDHLDAEYARVDAPGAPGYLTSANAPVGRRTVNLRYNEYLTEHREEEPGGRTVPATWDETWFVRLDPTDEYEENHELHELATTAGVLSSAAYKGEDRGSQPMLIQHDLRLLGFDHIEYHSAPTVPGNDRVYADHYHHVAYCLAYREVTLPDGETFPLVAVVIRGTASNCEWESNFFVTSDPESPVVDHEGFSIAAQEVEVDVLKLLIDRGIDLGSVRFLVTGHSRGAAVANLVAHWLCDGRLSNASGAITPQHVFAFCFACPSVTTSDEMYNPDFRNIHNFVNPEDFVPMVPLGLWGFGKYGVTHVLPSRSNCTPGEYRSYYNRMNDVFLGLSGGEPYKPYTGGSRLPLTLGFELYTDSPTVRELYLGTEASFSIAGHEVTLSSTRLGVFPTYYILRGAARHLGKYAEPSDYGIVTAAAAGHVGFVGALAATIFVDYGMGAVEQCFTPSSNYFIATEFAHAHTMETYLSWMLLNDMGVFRSSYRGLTVACPVDVYGYDADGNLVLSIVDDVVDEEVMAEGLAASVTDGVKRVDVPAGGDFRFEVVPRGEGTMTIVCEDASYGSERLGAVSYMELGLEGVESYELTMDADDGDEVTPFPDDVELVTSGGDVVEPDYATDDASGELVTVSVETEGAGVASGSAVLPRGGVTVAHATPAEGAEFHGWYRGGELVSGEPDLEVCADGDVEIVARFGTVDISGATVEVGDQVFAGRPCEPGVTVTLGELALVEGVDYVVDFSGNSAPGTATATVTGVGYFSGTASATFEIVEAIPMHRLYNRWTGEHLYTSDEGERDRAVAAGWTYEGIGWNAPPSGDPVYRLYNPWAPGGDHHYTMDEDEYDYLCAVGWVGEGLCWYSDPGHTVPVFREYNPWEFAHNHNYTADTSEHEMLIGVGWNDEGIGWYGV